MKLDVLMAVFWVVIRVAMWYPTTWMAILRTCFIFWSLWFESHCWAGKGRRYS